MIKYKLNYLIKWQFYFIINGHLLNFLDQGVRFLRQKYFAQISFDMDDVNVMNHVIYVTTKK